MIQYEETEQLAVDEKTKRLRYEKIRIKETKTEIAQSFKQVENYEAEID